MRQSVTAVAVVCTMAWTGPALAQRSALVPAAVHDAIVDEVSGDIALNICGGSRTITMAGEWYYGTVTIDDVRAYLDSAAKAGVVTVTERK